MPGIARTMEEFKKGTLHSGSKAGPIVHTRAQAIAIGLNKKPEHRIKAKDQLKALSK